MSTSKGFSLIEVLIVLSLLSVTTLMLVPAFDQLFERSQFDSEVSNVTARLQACAAAARQTQTTLTASVNGRADCSLASTKLQSVNVTASNALVFYPDGTSSGAELILSDDERKLVVLVDPLTSLIKHHSAPNYAR